ncbi:MAG TPA: hypothetical protein VHL80_06460 [Polyangia bacterium]|nr:hypothetical protein [Polyangia bacterium]
MLGGAADQRNGAVANDGGELPDQDAVLECACRGVVRADFR